MIPPEQVGNNSASREHPQLYAEQVRLLYRNAPLGLIATLINSAVLVFILRSVVPHRVLTAWFLCILLVSIARFVLLTRFRRVSQELSDVGRWGTWFVIGLALSGIIWGSAGIVLYPVESTIHQEFLAFVLGGMAIGAAGAFSVLMLAFIAYTVTSLAPLIVRFLAAGDEIHLAMGGMSLLFVVLITGIAFRISRATLASLVLRFEKNSLVAYLSSAKNDLEKKTKELADSQGRLRNLYIHLQSMREEERMNIARDVHDHLGQVLTALKMDLLWIDARLPDGNEGLNERIKVDVDNIDETIQAVRSVCTELRPGILDHFGLVAAIRWQAEEFQKRTGIKCETVFNSERIDVDADLRTHLFRIFQEALTNILRHAKATEVKVSLMQNDSGIRLEIADNGIGITEDQLSKHNSFGLLGMRERVYPWGGKVTIRGVKNKGTTVDVVIPATTREL